MSETRLTPEKITSLKGQTKLTCLTAYTAPMAQLLAPHVDMLLVGDSVGMVLHGFDNTLDVTMDMMVMHGAAVMRGLNAAQMQSFVIVDMPYGSYEDNAQDAVRNAKRLMDETGAHAVKLEGGVDLSATIGQVVAAGVPVMGHIGLQPQSVIKEGGYKIKGKDQAGIEKLIADAKAVEAAGAFALVLEGTLPEAARAVTQAIDIPVIGIGAAVECDGQVLVCDDMLGMHHGHVPKFVKQYTKLAPEIERAAQNFSDEVRSGAFPSEDYVYGVKKAG